MTKHNIKKCEIIYNPVSTGFKENDINLIAKTMKENNIIPNFKKSMYEGHLIELVKESDDNDTLVITLGGDGTVGEAYKAYNKIDQKGLYAHVPTGTTNDMAKNFDVRYKDADKIVKDILNGDVELFDSYKMNDEIVSYTSVFGYLAQVPYVTNKNMKKRLGHAGYVLSAFPYIIKSPEHYLIEYETDNIIGQANCILGAITNSKGFAGINLYKNVSLNDEKLELLLVRNANPKLIASLVSDYISNTIDLNKYKDYLIMDSSSNIRLTFKETYPKFAFDNDGEKSNEIITYGNDTVIYKPAKNKDIKKKSTRLNNFLVLFIYKKNLCRKSISI